MIVLLNAWMSAWAGDIAVSDPRGCLSEERLELDLRLALGDDVVDDLTVEASSAIGDPQTLLLVVKRGGRKVLDRSVSVDDGSCSILQEIVAYTITEGVERLPVWIRSAPPRLPVEAMFRAAGTGPELLVLGLSMGIRKPVTRRFGWTAESELLWSEVLEVRQGGGQLVGVMGHVGAGFDILRTKPATARLWSRVGAGFVHVVGFATRTDLRGESPRANMTFGLDWVNPTPIQLGIRGEVLFARTQFVSLIPEQGAFGVEEPFFRWGPTITIAGPLARSDDRSDGRP